MILTADQAEMLTDLGIDLDSVTPEEVAEILAENDANFDQAEADADETFEDDAIESGMTIEEALHAMPEGF